MHVLRDMYTISLISYALNILPCARVVISQSTIIIILIIVPLKLFLFINFVKTVKFASTKKKLIWTINIFGQVP